MPAALIEPCAPADDATRREFVAWGLSATLVFASGCGDDEPTDDGASGAREMRDAFRNVRIPEHPDRIVADSVSTYAHLVAIGVTPIGAAVPVDISPGYIGDRAGDVENLVADDGWTIDVEAALALRPDLIVAVGADYNRENCDRYYAAMTTYCYEDSDGTIADIKAKFTSLAIALGRRDEAAQAITAYDAKVNSTRQRIVEAGVNADPVGVVRFDAGGFIGIRVDESTNAVLASLGFREPKWPRPGDSGYVELSLETLPVLNAADTLLVCTDDNVVVDKLDVLDSPLWRRLDPVAAGRVHFVGAWNGSDILQLGRIVEDVEQAFLAGA